MHGKPLNCDASELSTFPMAAPEIAVSTQAPQKTQNCPGYQPFPTIPILHLGSLAHAPLDWSPLCIFVSST